MIIDGGSLFVGQTATPVIEGVDAAIIVRQPDRSSEHLLTHIDEYLNLSGISCLGVIENAVE